MRSIFISSARKQGHLIILLHGLNQTRKSLKKLEQDISREGFPTLNVSYPSTKHSIADLVHILHEKIGSELTKYNTVSFVSFSMGGLITRAYLNLHKIPNLGKVVMIAPPNNGSPIADFFKNFSLFKKVLGPASLDLLTTGGYIDQLCGSIYYECGIIAGDLPLDFYHPLFKGQPNDGKVSVDSTKLENMKDHAIVRAPHWYLPRSKITRDITLNFLKYSRFFL